ncbi:MAG: hypothetical protein ABI175_11475 [Polyangiales bacterium]
MRYGLVMALALGGCGTVAGTPDGALIDTTTVDATLRCNPNAPFGAGQRIAEIDTAAEEDFATLTADELTMYFSSTRTGTVGGYDLFTATRADRTSPWGNIQIVGGVNTTENERAPMVSEDQRTLYALTGVAPDYQIGVTTRTTAAGLFNGFSDAPVINSVGANEEGGTLLANALYFSTNRTGTYQLVRAARSGATLSTPLLVIGDMIDDPSGTAQPVVTPDELHLYFESPRAGGLGGDDIYYASRTNLADGFGVPINLGTLNTDTADFPTWVSADNCVLHFTNRSSGTYDLYTATRGR